MDAKHWLQKISPTRLDQLLLGLLGVGLVIGIATPFLTGAGTDSLTAAPATDEPLEADTLIPDGFVLVPIQLENQQALLAMMGAYAVLNIYESETQSATRGKLVAKSIKVLRAPFDPEALSVLAPEDKAALFMGSARGFYGVLQNRKANDLNVHNRARPQTVTPVETFEN